MKIKNKTFHSNSNKNIHVKKISFNGILNSEYFFHRSGPIKLALNQDRILRKNYYVKRARSKIDHGQLSKRSESRESEDLNISQEYRRNKTRIPSDLNKIIMKYGEKFLVQNERFHEYKNDNDTFMSYWHYINDVDEKKERKLMLDKYFNDKDKNSINYYTKEVKKMCDNMFKISPLLTGNKYIDIFFYYLNEFNKNYNDKKKVAYIKQKMKKFLEKLKDLLDFVEVIKDTGMDSITKDVKMKNSRYIREYEEKVALEKMRNAIKQRKEDIKSIKESKKMIKKTAKTLYSLEKNKKLLEEDISPLDINSKIEKSRNFLSPSRTPYSTQSRFHIISENRNTKMNNTASTAFYLSGKGFYTNKNNSKKLFFGLKDKNEVKENFGDILPMKKFKFKFYKLKPDNVSINRYSSLNLDSKGKRSSFHPTNYSKLTFQRFDIKKNLTTRKPNLITKIDKDKIASLNKNLSSTNLINTSKTRKIIFKSHISNLKDLSSKRLLDNSKESNLIKKRVKIENKNNSSYEASGDISKENNKNGAVNMKKVLNKNKSQLMSVYDNIKSRKKLNEKDKEDMKNYFVKKGRMDESMNSLKSIYVMDIIKNAKIITDKMDIEQRTKRVFQSHLSYEQTKKLESIRDINRQLKRLDINYIKDIIKYKSNK